MYTIPHTTSLTVDDLMNTYKYSDVPGVHVEWVIRSFMSADHSTLKQINGWHRSSCHGNMTSKSYTGIPFTHFTEHAVVDKRIWPWLFTIELDDNIIFQWHHSGNCKASLDDFKYYFAYILVMVPSQISVCKITQSVCLDLDPTNPASIH